MLLTCGYFLNCNKYCLFIKKYAKRLGLYVQYADSVALDPISFTNQRSAVEMILVGEARMRSFLSEFSNLTRIAVFSGRVCIPEGQNTNIVKLF